MISIELKRSGTAHLDIGIATFDGKMMMKRSFVVDTGATRTTIPKDVLTNELGYSETFIQNNKILLPDAEKPLMANGKRADVYKIKAPRMNIGDHEIQSDYILTSDSVKSLNSLLGLDILSYFKFIFDFDAIDKYAPYGRMFYQFRQSRFKPFISLDEPFAYSLSGTEE